MARGGKTTPLRAKSRSPTQACTCSILKQKVVLWSVSLSYNKLGSDINSIQPYGNVTIESGGNVEINVGDKVIIKNDFEVKLGGRLLIQ